MKAAPGFEPGMKVLQTSALPLGYAAAKDKITHKILLALYKGTTGIEPTPKVLEALC
jgi:hypothetical protein